MSALGRHPNGSMAPDDLLRMAKQQQQAEQQAQQMMMAALQGALHNPHVVHQINISICGVAIAEDGAKTLMIAQPNGERSDIRLSDRVAMDVGRALLKRTEEGPEGEAA